MALHAKPAFNDPASVSGRARQLALSLEYIRVKTDQLIQMIQGDSLTYVLLTQLAEQIRSSRDHIAGANGVGFGDIKSLDVRQYLADHDSVSYSSVADVSALLNGLDSALVAMNTDYRVLITGREAQPGGAIVTDSGTELIQDAAFTSVETAALLTTAQAAASLIDKTTYINGLPT